MSYDGERLMALLPEIERVHDAEAGGVLGALLDVLAGQADRVDTNIRQLYDDWFIETCAEWVVPYIGDLLGVRGVHRVGGTTFSQRAWVANTIGYRRRKGTLSMLRQLAQDTTGEPAAATEYLGRVAWTQYLNHVRLDAVRTFDLRSSNELELIGGAFDPVPHAVDVRSIARGRGRHNIPNVGLFLWRLRAFPMTGVSARAVTSPSDGRFHIHPVGLDAPLFNPGRPVARVTDPAREADMPGALRRRALFDELEAIRRASLGIDVPPSLDYFAQGDPVVSIRVKGEVNPIPASEIFVANLESWGNLPTSRTYRDATGAPVTNAIRVGFDPVNGRIKFTGGPTPKAVDVDLTHAFGSAIGGGPYDRSPSLAGRLPDRVTWQRIVSTGPRPASEPDIVPTLVEAIAQWNASGAGQDGVIAVVDSQTYKGDLTINVSADSHLVIVAASWAPVPTEADRGILEHRPADLAPTELRPHVLGTITVTGSASDASTDPGILAVGGLLIEGSLTVAKGNLGRLFLDDVTLVPAAGGLSVEASPKSRTNRSLVIELVRTICGPIGVAAPAARLAIVDGIVDGPIVATRTPVELDRTTALGVVGVRRLDASDVIFGDVVTVERTQEGCVRFSFVPAPSRIPRAYRCQPDQAVRDRPSEPEAAVRAAMTPSFVSVRYGDPTYLQLASSVASEILTGASNGDQMGAFCRELHAQREANLRSAFEEYLRVGLAAGVFMST